VVNVKRVVSVIIVFLLLLSPTFLIIACGDSGGGKTGESESFSPETERQIEEAVNKDLELYGGKEPVPGVAIGIWAPGKGTYVKGFGVSDLTTGEPMSVNDKFRVGSNTKTFVVTVILQLVDEGKLTLDDNLARFNLGVEVPNAENITVRQLCNMTSGLFEVYNSPTVGEIEVNPLTHWNPQDLVAMAVKNPPYFPPGEGWNYSNTNYILLGMIIEKLTGNKAEEEIARRCIEPLGLTNTSFPLDYPGMPCPYSHGYALDEAGGWQDVTILYPPSLMWTAGAMTSDMADMKTWVKAYVTGETNSEATQKDRLDVVDTGKEGMYFGLGIAFSGDWWGYTGGLEGYNTAAYYLPEEDAYVIAFVTAKIDNPGPGVANAIFRDICAIIYPDHVPFSGTGAGL
jgi:D-alanyl-D-alanine carboxypeptidase